MPLYLHIFEPRYKLMIGECIRESKPFGVVLIKSGQEIGEIGETHMVGTTAHITQVKRLEGGEMNIASVGQSRFKISSTHLRNPYLTGLVEDFPLSNLQDSCIPSYVRKLTPMVKKYLNIFAMLGNVDFKLEKLPDDPVTLAFLTAVVLNVPAKDKQMLLMHDDLALLLKTEHIMLAREALILKHLIEKGPHWRDESGLFSPN